MSDQAPIERLAPNSPDAEEAVLGSILINPDAWHDVAAFLISADFFIMRNAWVWDAINAVQERGEAIDNLTVIEELRSRGQLDQVGGSAYITYLINSTPTHIHAETYGRIVERAAIRRRLLTAASDVAQTALEENAEISQVCDHAITVIEAATTQRGLSDIKPSRELASAYYDRIAWRYAHPHSIVGIPTGIDLLDKKLSGLQKQQLILVAGRPGMGKSSFALGVALHVTKMLKMRVAIYSLEMSEEQLMNRLFSQETGIDSQRLRNAELSDREWSLFTEATNRMGKYPFFIDDTPMPTIRLMRKQCRKLKRTVGLDLLIIDYLQLMVPDGDESENATQEITKISRSLKVLARELDIPILCCAQLNRKVEDRKDKRPMLADLRQSGSLEQDADVVLFIYRDVIYHEDTERPNVAEINTAKQREGPTGMVETFFNAQTQLFSNLHKGEINLTQYWPEVNDRER